MADEDPEYLSWIRRQSCCYCQSFPADPHHQTGAGMGLRAHDHESMPLCRNCHRGLHDGRILRFKDDRRAFERQMARLHRDLYLALNVETAGRTGS